jgi:hypothetical protein
MSATRVALGLVVALLALALTPADAWAWTPGTHIFLGEAVLQTAHLLPGPIAELIRAFPLDFLYGSIAADTSIAKKYVPVGRHCHSWTVGFEIHDAARDEPLRAFGLGYLAHLAADVVAHNFYVPHQLAVTASTTTVGHSYWESRIDTHLGEAFPHKAVELIRRDHARADGHLDRILSPTIFSTPTNRRIFRGMVYAADLESWQRMFQFVRDNSRWDLPDEAVGRYMMRSYEYIMDLFDRLDRSEPYAFDPSGDVALRTAKRVRRAAVRSGGDPQVREEAARHFGLPATALDFAARVGQPLYPPPADAAQPLIRAASS